MHIWKLLQRELGGAVLSSLCLSGSFGPVLDHETLSYSRCIREDTVLVTEWHFFLLTKLILIFHLWFQQYFVTA